MTPPKDLPRPTESELEILNILWERGPSTVRQVHERLAETKKSQYTTTLKLMQIMAEKCLLARDESERSHVYKPNIERNQVQQQFAGYLLDRVFGGSARSLLIGALGARRASKKELAELRAMLDDYEKGRK
jgi:predicted transcriptional regulator